MQLHQIIQAILDKPPDARAIEYQSHRNRHASITVRRRIDFRYRRWMPFGDWFIRYATRSINIRRMSPVNAILEEDSPMRIWLKIVPPFRYRRWQRFARLAAEAQEMTGGQRNGENIMTLTANGAPVPSNQPGTARARRHSTRYCAPFQYP
jgi:hypothetical protein